MSNNFPEREKQAGYLVIGGGIVGTAVAERLATRGAKVILVEYENGELSSSVRSMGWVNDAAPTSPAYHRLRKLGRLRLIEEQNKSSCCWYKNSGTLTWDDGKPHQALNTATLSLTETPLETVVRLKLLGQNASVLTPAEAVQIEPALDPFHISGPVLFNKDDGWVDLSLLIRELRERAAACGCRILRRQAVFLL